MRVLRTPEDRFADLPGFDYPARYAQAGELRMAYVEAGPADGEPVLLLHGEPSWSFLYRTMLPVLAGAGLRAIAADLPGFGRSDKPAEVGDYSFARLVEWVRAFAFDALGLRGLTLVGQDWGGLIGLRLVAEHPDRFARVVAANTGLPTGDQAMPDVWLRFREVVRTAPTLDVPRLVQSGCQSVLPDEVLAAYQAPFPDPSYMAAVRAMPNLVPTSPDDPASEANRAAWQRLTEWRKPFLVAFSDRDPITGAMAPILKRAIPGAAGIEHPVIAGAGHFLQEDAGDRLAAAVVDFVRAHPAVSLSRTSSRCADIGRPPLASAAGHAARSVITPDEFLGNGYLANYNQYLTGDQSTGLVNFDPKDARYSEWTAIHVGTVGCSGNTCWPFKTGSGLNGLYAGHAVIKLEWTTSQGYQDLGADPAYGLSAELRPTNDGNYLVEESLGGPNYRLIDVYSSDNHPAAGTGMCVTDGGQNYSNAYFDGCGQAQGQTLAWTP